VFFLPNAGFPQGVKGLLRPIGARPSPPPCGWSHGFITEPRTVGRFPNQRVRPAFPLSTKNASLLLNSPIVAKHPLRINLISLDGNLTVTKFSCLARIFADVPAERTICPPRLGINSILWTDVPKGISSKGRAFPISNEIPFPDKMVSRHLNYLDVEYNVFPHL